MKQHAYKSREEYIDAQVIRSQKKMEYCKVHFQDVYRYRQLITEDMAGRSGALLHSPPQPILCLGVRSGAEVDMFRSVFFGPLMQWMPVRQHALRKDNNTDAANKIKLAERFSWGAGNKNDGKVMGVEINPDAYRPDIHIGSYDDLPDDWADKYMLLYSNSFDHSMDPAKTVASWRKVAAPGAYVIIAFIHNAEPSETDPLGGLSLESISELWQAPIVFASQTMNRNGYQEICFRLD